MKKHFAFMSVISFYEWMVGDVDERLDDPGISYLDEKPVWGKHCSIMSPKLTIEGMIGLLLFSMCDDNVKVAIVIHTIGYHLMSGANRCQSNPGRPLLYRRNLRPLRRSCCRN